MRTICIDIDGTICHYIEWVDAKTFGEVLPHCAQTIHHLKADGWYVIIYTTRANKDEIGKFLTEHNIPFDAINENPNQPDNAKGGKPNADVYVDDRAIQFDGDWAGAYEKITGFTTWEEAPAKPTEPPLDYCGQLLVNDFVQSMYTHRHYDTLNWQITKFAFSEILVSIGACWTVFNWDLAKETTPNLKWIVMSIICGASLVFGIISIFTIVKNRVYFVRTSRHINELRHHVLLRHPYGFKNETNFWENPQYPSVKDYDSTQFLSLYMLVFLNMIIAGVFMFSVLRWCQYENILLIILFSLVPLASSLIIIWKVAKEIFDR